MSNKYEQFSTPLGRFDMANKKARKVLTVDEVGDQPEEMTFSAGPEDQYPQIPSMEQLASGRPLQREEVKKIKQQNQSAPLPSDMKNTIDILLGLGRGYRDVEVEDVVFTLRTLSPKELVDIVTDESFLNEEGSDQAKAFKRNVTSRNLTLTASIWKIDGLEWRTALRTKDPEVKLKIIENMDHAVVEHLFNQYIEMVDLHNKKFATAEEVVEAVKK